MAASCSPAGTYYQPGKLHWTPSLNPRLKAHLFDYLSFRLRSSTYSSCPRAALAPSGAMGPTSASPWPQNRSYFTTARSDSHDTCRWGVFVTWQYSVAQHGTAWYR